MGYMSILNGDLVWYNIQVNRRISMSPYNLALNFDSIRMIVTTFLDIMIMWYLLSYTLKIVRNNSRTIQIFKGILFILVADSLAKFFGLKTVGFIADMFVNWGILAIIIVFQPEIRNLLEKMGKTSIFSKITSLSGNEKEHLVGEIVTATMLLSKNQCGALISIEQGHSLSDFIKTGTPLNSNLTAELLTSIFVTTTPLHDGAVIIQGDKIACASAYFPPTNLELPSRYGARHRAAIGISEITDCITIVVSEETGHISIAENGQIFTVNRKQLHDYLMRVICGVTTEITSLQANVEVSKAQEDVSNKQEEEKTNKQETSVLSKLSVKKQTDAVKKIEAEEIVSDGEEVKIVKDSPEVVVKPKEKKKKKSMNFFNKQKKEEAKVKVSKEEEIEKLLDEEENSIKLPHKKEKPVINDYEQDIKPSSSRNMAKQQVVKKVEPEMAKAKKQTKELKKQELVMPKEVVKEEPKVVEKSEPETKVRKVVEPVKYERQANIRVMGIDPLKETLNDQEVKVEPEVKKEKKDEFDTNKIDISKLMGYENELDNSFELLDKNYQNTKKGGKK